MNLKKSGRMLWIVAAVAMLAMVLQGCGGDDGVSPSTHDDLQSDYNALKADYDALVEMVGAMGDDANMDGSLYAQINHYMGAASAATDQANSLMMQIGSMEDPANMDGSLYAQINHYMGAASAATDQANNLMMQIGSMEDPANVDGSLYAQINYYMAAADDLMMQIGSMEDPANMEGSLYAQINHYMAQASGLRTQIGSMEDPANMEGSLYAQINYHTEAANTAAGEASGLRLQIGSMDDEANNAEGATLYAQINYHMAEASGLRTQIGAMDDEANDSEDASLYAQLNAAKDRIAELEAGTAPDLLDPIVEDAMAAYTAANTASMDADTAADEAETAAENRATMQTGMANSVMDAATARMHADTAETEAGKAETASEMAQSAANTADATAQKIAAETAQGNAETAKGLAETARGDAVADAAMELKIDGSMKSVGGTSVDDTAGANSITVNGETTITGRLADSLQPNHTVIAFGGQAFTANEAPTDDVPYEQAYDARTFDIGNTLDSSDDTARLMLVTQYAGTMAVNVYSLGTDEESGTESGRISIDVTATTGTTETNNVVLRSEGMHYRATTASGNTGGVLEFDDSIASDAEGVEVFSYVDPNDNTRGYVVLTTETTTNGDTTWTYTDVDVTALASDATEEGTAEPIKIIADIPAAVAYDHIEFGVWAALGEAAEDGSQDVDDLGIGFVQNHSGMGMTGADMPNNGTAAYSGNWVATVQSRHANGEGAIALTNGTASLSADFGDGDFTATLDNLAVLEGVIAGNTFSGTEVTSVADTRLNTTADAGDTYTGSFSGGFYGSKAAEAGGVFDFMSDGMEDGGFRGAFGAARD